MAKLLSGNSIKIVSDPQSAAVHFTGQVLFLQRTYRVQPRFSKKSKSNNNHVPNNSPPRAITYALSHRRRVLPYRHSASNKRTDGRGVAPNSLPPS